MQFIKRFKARAVAITLLTAGTGVGLAGCITLLPEAKPIQLYTIRFNPDLLDKGNVAPPAAPPPAEPVDVYLNFDSFPRAAAGDRILTVEGNEASYVAGGRWASNAQGQFRDVLSEGFAREGSDHVRIVSQGRVAGEYRLDINVRRFETTYERRRPTVRVAMDARLVRVVDREVVVQRYITSEAAIRKSDLSMIVEGYEKASSQAVVDLIGFTEEAVAAAQVQTAAEASASASETR